MAFALTLVSRRVPRGRTTRCSQRVNTSLLRARTRAQRRRARVGGNAPHCIRTHSQSATLQHRILAVAGARRYCIESALLRPADSQRPLLSGDSRDGPGSSPAVARARRQGGATLRESGYDDEDAADDKRTDDDDDDHVDH